MDIEELKSAWKSQNHRLEKLESQNRLLEQKICDNRLDDGRKRLRRTYIRLALVGVVMIPVVLAMFPKFNISMWLTILYATVMLIMTVANLYVLGMLNKLDFTSLTLCEAMKGIVRLEQTRQRLRIGCIILSLSVVAVFLYEMYFFDMSCFIGGVTGGVVGCIIGLRKEHQIKKVIRSMKADLADAMSME
ncbi:MAG: hypothetical protein NC082_08680 [Clostridiales bacterium]|nr:hypothetical protein [Clostridiales bacterium]